MIYLQTPRGLPVAVPETENEDPSPRFNRDEVEKIRAYYADHGYVVVRGLLDRENCTGVRRLWDSEVKPSRSFIYRQATAKAERHSKNNLGWVMNPILNLQSMDPSKFGKFRSYSTERILTNAALASCFSSILGDAPKIVQSMYFEGNSATWEHQDTYYLDSAELGSMAGAWIALEDISPEAGRFFVCDQSHRIKLAEQSIENNIAEHHEEYIQSVVREIRDRQLEIRAPALQTGDVLFWNSRTIHGSLASHDAQSRSSITVHAIPESHQFLQLQNRIKPLRLKKINNVLVHHPKDLASAQNRLLLAVEGNFPGLFYAMKRRAVITAIRFGQFRKSRRPFMFATKN